MTIPTTITTTKDSTVKVTATNTKSSTINYVKTDTTSKNIEKTTIKFNISSILISEKTWIQCYKGNGQQIPCSPTYCQKHKRKHCKRYPYKQCTRKGCTTFASCLRKDLECNGQKDCENNIDENNCSKTKGYIHQWNKFVWTLDIPRARSNEKFAKEHLTNTCTKLKWQQCKAKALWIEKITNQTIPKGWGDK